MRWYLLYVSPAWTPTRFDVEGLKEVQSKFFNTLKNTYNFFTLYANTDGIDPRTFFVDYDKRPEIDRWMLSKYNRLVQEVRGEMEIYDLTKAVRKIQNFVNEDLSNWYIRRNRRRFWGSELTEDKKAVFNTTFEVLEGLARLVAPFAPYISEEIYTKLTGAESVHLADYPAVNEALIDEAVEAPMDLVRDLVSLGRSAREEAQIKVRQPLSEIIIDGKYKDTLGDLTRLMEEELNIKKVDFEDNLGDFMNYTLKPNFKVAGPILGKNVKLLGKALAGVNPAEVVAKLDAGEVYPVEIDGETIELTKDFVDVRIAAKDGFNVQTGGNKFIILDTTLSPELINEGYARECVSRIQQLRKNSGFEVNDHIDITYQADDEVTAAIEAFADFIKKETLAESITKGEGNLEACTLNGHEAAFGVAKVQ